MICQFLRPRFLKCESGICFPPTLSGIYALGPVCYNIVSKEPGGCLGFRKWFSGAVLGMAIWWVAGEVVTCSEWVVGLFWCGQSSVLCEVVWRDIGPQGLDRQEWAVLCTLTEGRVKWRDRLGLLLTQRLQWNLSNPDRRSVHVSEVSLFLFLGKEY